MSAEQALIDSLATYGDTLAVICYHIHDIYSTQEAEERWAFYDSVIIPSVVFDGTEDVFVEFPPFEEIYRDYVDLARGVTPYFNLYINNATASPTTGSINLRIVTADTIPDDEIVAFVSILEDSLPGTYGMFYHVCRSLFQFPVTLAYPDTLDTTITFSHNILVDKMNTVVFVQDMDTKEVMQAIIEKFEEE